MAAYDLQSYYEHFDVVGITDYWRAKAGFWKLRQISIGYDFIALMPTISPVIKGLRLSLVANNVAILKKWVQNMDPEDTSDYSDTGNGESLTTLPPVRNLGFNLNVRF